MFALEGPGLKLSVKIITSISRLLASDKAFERESSFCSLTRPFLQNEDPVGFACDRVRQSTFA